MGRVAVSTFAPTLVLASGLLVLARPAQADPEPVRQQGNLALGLGGGTSTAGISAKYFLRESLSLQGVLGAGYGSDRWSDGPGGGWDSGLGLGADLLFEMPAFHETPEVELAWSVGPGVGLWLTDDWAALAASGVAGFEVNVSAVPIDLVIEYRPRLLVVPDLAFDFVNFSGHIRYVF